MYEVRYWPEADVSWAWRDVCFQRQSGHDADRASLQLLTQSGRDAIAYPGALPRRMSSLFGAWFADKYRPAGLIIVRPTHHMKLASFER